MPAITLPLTMIRAQSETQMREKFQEAVIKEYAEAMLAGDIFPPVSVVFDGEEYWLWDGFHRVRAARMAQVAEMPADVQDGTRQDAILLAIGANKRHGVQRTNADKRRAVLALLCLRLERLENWNNSQMASMAGVNEWLVRKLLKEKPELELPSVDCSGNPSNQPGDEGELHQQEDSEETEPSLFDFDASDEIATEPDPVEVSDDSEEPEETWEEKLAEEEPKPKPQTEFIPLADLIFAGVTPLLAKNPEGYKANFNRTNENVEWALWTWNPVTGCLHDCSYCYARDIAIRMYPAEQGFTPTFHPDRLSAPRLMKPPDPAKILRPFDPQGCSGGIGEKNVFVCSMADLFGKWVPREWVDAVLAEVIAAPAWNFLFLTKFPQRLCEFEWPANAWVGTTVDRQYRVDIAEKAFRKVTAGVKWLSCEPLLEPLQFSSLEMFDWVVVGGSSRSTQTPEFQPPREWVTRLHTQALAAGCRWYEKENLRPERVREYPGQ